MHAQTGLAVQCVKLGILKAVQDVPSPKRRRKQGEEDPSQSAVVRLGPAGSKGRRWQPKPFRILAPRALKFSSRIAAMLGGAAPAESRIAWVR